MAEILKMYYPKQVELHNYVVANSTATKIDNWVVLNRKVLTKLNLGISRKTMTKLAYAVPGTVQKLLVAVHKTIFTAIRAESNPQVYFLEENTQRETVTAGVEVYTIPIKRPEDQFVIGHQKVVPLAAYEKKRAELIAKTEEAEHLARRVEHLESLIDLKEKRIKYLNSQIYHGESTNVDFAVKGHRFSVS